MGHNATEFDGFCRDCFAAPSAEERRCKACGSPRLLRHPELHDLSIAHIDCDAFYAAVEKRDNPDLRDKPVLIGGGKRGVVSTACYVARIRGAKSAMPMFKALQLVPDAIVIRPNMAKYSEVGRQVRDLMLQFTPAVEPLSIDEAFLDLTGTAKLHSQSPAVTLAKLVKRMEADIGISASVGLAPNKFLAKVASDLEKPRGFSIIGSQEAKSFLARRPVGLIWGVGPAMQGKLARDGISLIGQLQQMSRNDLLARYGSMGDRLYYLSRGEDVRRVSADEESKSIGAETTFFEDISSCSELEAILWPLCEKVARRAKRSGLLGRTITLKLKTSDFKLRSRSVSLTDPTQLAHRMFEALRPLLQKEATGPKFRLIGVSLSNIAEDDHASHESLDARENAATKAELAMDKIRDKFGLDAVERGLATRAKER